MEWNAALYDNKHDFVAEYGKGLLEYIPANEQQAILDLGCGTGTLTVQLLNYGNRVVGVDRSQSMIDKAREQYREIEFLVCDACALPFEQEFDVVFSNAVLHWISDHNLLLQNIHKVLKKDGLFVCEFGADGNIAMIEQAFTVACERCGYAYHSKFHFPKTDAFGALLESNGFLVDTIYDFDRPTVLKDGNAGLANWMRQFYAAELSALPEQIQAEIIRTAERLAEDSLWNGKEWVADYRRLRVIAYRSSE